MLQAYIATIKQKKTNLAHLSMGLLLPFLLCMHMVGMVVSESENKSIIQS